jgi:hypothetical protein
MMLAQASGLGQIDILGLKSILNSLMHERSGDYYLDRQKIDSWRNNK